MCRFITIVAPEACREHTKDVLERHRGYSSQTHNPQIASALPKSVQFVSPSAGCDCGTVLGNRRVDSISDFNHEKFIEKCRRKGWSEAKIERSLSDKEHGRATTTHKSPSDSFELWARILDDLVSTCSTEGPIAILVHEYSGSLDEPRIALSRKRVSASENYDDALRALAEDELVMFDQKWFRARSLRRSTR